MRRDRIVAHWQHQSRGPTSPEPCVTWCRAFVCPPFKSRADALSAPELEVDRRVPRHNGQYASFARSGSWSTNDRNPADNAVVTARTAAMASNPMMNDPVDCLIHPTMHG